MSMHASRPGDVSPAATAPRGLHRAALCRGAAIALIGLALGAWAASPVAAHHAFAAEFDANKPIKLKGKVVRTEWINPHSWIHIDVPGKGGVERWAIEGGPPNALFRRGFNKNSLPVGTEILVEGFQAKDGSRKANGRDLTFADGKRLFLGSSGTGAPGEKR